ncbi:MAG: DUF4102 domain-containing protein [Rubrivivax sp.]|nr:DUF4102 domain-containing protein [Rubrivivax sp.]
MAIHLLSATEVRASDVDQSDGGGLFLRVKPDGKAAWVWRFTAPSGRRRELGLGVAWRAATTSG